MTDTPDILERLRGLVEADPSQHVRDILFDAISEIADQKAEIERLRAELAALRNEGRWEPGLHQAAAAVIRSQAAEIERLKAHVTRLSGCLLVIASAHRANATDLRMTALAASANGRTVEFCRKSLGVTMPQDGGAS